MTEDTKKLETLSYEPGVPVLAADIDGNLLEEKELRELDKHIKKVVEKRQLPDGAKLPVFLSANRLRSFIPKDLAVALSEPIVYIDVKSGRGNGVAIHTKLMIYMSQTKT